MAKIKCPKCNYSESDGRPHDKATYFEVCAKCAAKYGNTIMSHVERPLYDGLKRLR